MVSVNTQTLEAVLDLIKNLKDQPVNVSVAVPESKMKPVKAVVTARDENENIKELEIMEIAD